MTGAIIRSFNPEFTTMAGAIRILLVFAMLAPLACIVGCNRDSDSTPNTVLGPAPVIPAGRGSDPSGTGPVDPKAQKQRKK
jgi:hypothetical protein